MEITVNRFNDYIDYECMIFIIHYLPIKIAQQLSVKRYFDVNCYNKWWKSFVIIDVIIVVIMLYIAFHILLQHKINLLFLSCCILILLTKIIKTWYFNTVNISQDTEKFNRIFYYSFNLFSVFRNTTLQFSLRILKFQIN